MARQSLRENMLEAGLRVMFRKGLQGAGVREIAAEASAPHGSFTNHFGSKEDFASEVLERYFTHVKRLVAQALEDETLSPRARLLKYLDIITDRLAEDGFTRGCLIGDFSLETPQVSEQLRNKLVLIYSEWRQPFAECIAAAQAAGEISDRFEPIELAEFLIASWEGAILRMKVERSGVPLERFKRIAFATIFSKENQDA